MDRREFFKQGIKKIFKAADKITELKEKIPILIQKTISEEALFKEENIQENSIQLQPPKRRNFRNIQFPPGAVKPKKEFVSKCTSCGDCINACPYNTIFPVYEEKYNKNLPYIDVNMNPCFMCFNYPCIQSCRYDALVPFSENQKPKFGQAKLIFENCLNSDENYECNVCERVCPIENVVTIKNKKPKFSRDCTGCGICVQNCPTFPKAIVVK